MELRFTGHAVQVITERKIRAEWVEHAVREPAWREPDPHDPEVERFFRRIPERSDRTLRVAVNTATTPWRVVSAFFDRNARKKP